LDDWRLQLLELLPAAQLQLTQAQACSRQFVSKSSPAVLSLLFMLRLLSATAFCTFATFTLHISTLL